MNKSHAFVILQALFVTFLWSTSWVLIKIGLEEIPALTFAGLRYTIAFIALVIYMILTKKLSQFKYLERSQLKKILLLGVVWYFFTQGAQFLGIFYLPTIQVSLFLNFTPIIVMIFAAMFIGEKPSKNQILGVVIYLGGVLLYFFPIESSDVKLIGYLIMIVGVIANAMASVLGRNINRSKKTSPVLITTISMGVGGILLLMSGVAINGVPSISVSGWAIIFWLAIVNTAIAFTLWNRTMRYLTSVESSIINGTMLIQIAVLSWIFLDQELSSKSIISIVIVTCGVIFVQYKKRKKQGSNNG